MSRLEQKIPTLRRRGDHDRDLVFRKVGNEFCDTGKRANGWPETILADRALYDVFLLRERDVREEREEVGDCFLFDLSRKRVRSRRWVDSTRRGTRLCP